MKRRLLAALAVATLALGLGAGIPSAARADDSGISPDANAAIAINTTNGARLFELAFDVRHVAGDVVDQQNVAVAYSSCESCQTIAIAIEIVLVDSSPSTVTPENAAVSVNYQCTLCTSYAAAYQFVIGGNGPLEFTKRGLHELHDIQKELERLKKEFERGDISLAEVKARVEALMARLKVVLQTELVPARREKNNQEGGGGNRGSPTAQPSTTDTTSTDESTTEPTDTTSTDTTTTAPTDTTTTTTTTTTPTTTGATTGTTP